MPAGMALELRPGEDRLDAGRHAVTFEEIREVFVDGFPGSATRAPLFESFSLVRAAIMRVVPIREQWIDGSFVTRKQDPVDIDLVTVFDGEQLDALDGPDRTLLKGL